MSEINNPTGSAMGNLMREVGNMKLRGLAFSSNTEGETMSARSFEEMIAYLLEHLNPVPEGLAADSNPETTLEEAGFDSVHCEEVRMSLEDFFDVSLAGIDVGLNRTLGNLYEQASLA